MSSALGVQILVAIIAASGGLTGIVLLLRLPSDKNSAAVTQAQGAIAGMDTLNRALTTERNYWRTRALIAERACEAHGITLPDPADEPDT